MAHPSPQPQQHAMPLGSAPAEWTAEPSAGSVGAQISNQIVSLLREVTGRGPTKAKTTVSSDLVVTTLGDCLTPLEQQLIVDDHIALVEAARNAVHVGMRMQATTIVEALTRRHVAAYLTDHQSEPDVAVLVFFLTPPTLTAA